MTGYGDYIFYQLISTEFVKKKLVGILISLSSNILCLQISTGISKIISIHPFIDPISEVVISIICSLNIHIFYNFLQRYTPEYRKIAIYLLQNYNIENYLWWKKIIVLSFSTYICILLLFVEITNKLIYRYIFQYIICFFIIEQIENGNIKNYFKFNKYPKIKKCKTKPQMIDSYSVSTCVNTDIGTNVGTSMSKNPKIKIGKSAISHISSGTHFSNSL